MNEGFRLDWSWHSSIVIGFSIWTAAYVLLVGFLRRKHGWGEQPSRTTQFFFHLGTLIALLAFVSPLDSLGDQYLFSAHMVQHLLLMFVTAPLWLVGTPAWLMDLVVPLPFRKIVEWVTRPVSAFAIFVGIMVVWHIPTLYNLTLQSEGIHIFEHLTFIGAALIGWWPVAAPNSTMSPPLRMLYLFLLGIPGTALSAMLTFASTPLYPFYTDAPRLFGLSVLDDQHLAGLLMWIPMHMILFLAFGITFFKWFNTEIKQADSIYSKSLS